MPVSDKTDRIWFEKKSRQAVSSNHYVVWRFQHVHLERGGYSEKDEVTANGPWTRYEGRIIAHKHSM